MDVKTKVYWGGIILPLRINKYASGPQGTQK